MSSPRSPYGKDSTERRGFAEFGHKLNNPSLYVGGKAIARDSWGFNVDLKRAAEIINQAHHQALLAYRERVKEAIRKIAREQPFLQHSEWNSALLGAMKAIEEVTL